MTLTSTRAVPPRPWVSRQLRVAAVVALCGEVVALAGGMFAFGLGGAPSDPGDANTTEAGALDQPTLFVGGLLVLAVAGSLFVVTIRLCTRAHLERARLQFVAPPGWPIAPLGGAPAASWRAPDDWPPAPLDWQYWRSPPGFNSMLVTVPRTP